jgi:hypothetical protein
MCDMEWTKVMMEWVVQEGIVDAEEYCSLLCFRRPWEETQIETV